MDFNKQNSFSAITYFLELQRNDGDNLVLARCSGQGIIVQSAYNGRLVISENANNNTIEKKSCILQRKKMGNLAINSRILERYFRFLTKLDNNSKKRLIIKLTESIETEKEEKTDLKMLYGAWIDDRDSDEIIKEIRDSRIEKRDIAAF